MFCLQRLPRKIAGTFLTSECLILPGYYTTISLFAFSITKYYFSWIQIVEGEGCVKIAAVFFRVDLKEEEKKYASKSDFFILVKVRNLSFTEPKKANLSVANNPLVPGENDVFTIKKWGFHTPGESKSKCCCCITPGEDMKPKYFCLLLKYIALSFWSIISIKAFWTLYNFFCQITVFLTNLLIVAFHVQCAKSRGYFQAEVYSNSWLLHAMSNIESRGNFRKFFGRIQKQFSSSSLVESRSSFQAVLWSNPEAVFKQSFGRIQKRFSSSPLVESWSSFQAVLWSNPEAFFKQSFGLW